MIKKLVYRLAERRHFWRYASFPEIAELYVSRTTRTIAMNIVSGFTSVYLYEQGYSLVFIIGFWLCYHLARVPISLWAGSFVARFGPKYSVLISNLLYVPAMAALALTARVNLIEIVIWGVFMAMSVSIYQVAYIVDFSKVKNIEHAGKEIAFVNILEKIAIGISPVIGGIVALWFGLQLVIWLAAILFILSALPLFSTAKPTKTHKSIKFSGFPWRLSIRSLIAEVGVGFDYVTTGVVWSLFIVIIVFPGVGWDVYVMLGILSSVTILAAVATSYAYGKLIDKSQGGSLLKISVVANALVHMSRPFAMTPVAIVGTNITNEAATVGYNMAFTRGIFDVADLSGYRVTYLCLAEAVSNLGAAIACAVLIICTTILGDSGGLKIFFFFAAGFVLLVGTAHFRLYRK